MFGTTGATFSSLVNTIMTVIYTLEWLLSGVAMAIFILGVIKMIWSAGSTKSQREGYTLLVWGLVAMFIIFSIQAILFFMCNNFLPGTSCTFFYWTGGAPT